MSTSQPEVLNAIASTGGTARTLARAIEAGDAAVRAEMRPHIDTIAIADAAGRDGAREMMHELRYGRQTAVAPVEPPIVNRPGARGRRRSGSTSAPATSRSTGYINVDMRELPGIDVVATGRRPAVRTGHGRRDLQQPHRSSTSPRSNCAGSCCRTGSALLQAGWHTSARSSPTSTR